MHLWKASAAPLRSIPGAQDQVWSCRKPTQQRALNVASQPRRKDGAKTHCHTYLQITLIVMFQAVLWEPHFNLTPGYRMCSYNSSYSTSSLTVLKQKPIQLFSSVFYFALATWNKNYCHLQIEVLKLLWTWMPHREHERTQLWVGGGCEHKDKKGEHYLRCVQVYIKDYKELLCYEIPPKIH